MLEELGATADEVADCLRKAGVRGIRNSARFLNPIVRYAHSKLSRGAAIDLILGDRLRMVFAEGDPVEIPVPGPVLRFLERFHEGHYPDLEM
jgi:hypothetical protein